MMKDNLVELFTDALLGMLPLAPEIPEGRGGVIQDFFLPDGMFNFILQARQVRQLCIPGGDAGTVDLGVLQVAAQAAYSRTEAGDGRQLRGQQHAALQCFSQACICAFGFRQGRGAGVFNDAAGGSRFLHTGIAKPLIQDGFCFRQQAARGL